MKEKINITSVMQRFHNNIKLRRILIVAIILRLFLAVSASCLEQNPKYVHITTLTKLIPEFAVEVRTDVASLHNTSRFLSNINSIHF